MPPRPSSSDVSLIAFEPEGLLLYGSESGAAEALAEALEDVYQLPETPADVSGATTAWQSAFSLLRQANLDEVEIAARRDVWIDYAADLYRRRLTEERLPQLVAAGARDLLESLRDRGHRLAAVSRQLSPLLRLQLEGAGLAGLFDVVVGGEEAAYHTGLYPVARAKAAPLAPLEWARHSWPAQERLAEWPRERTVAVGATPGLVCRAHSDPVRVVLWADAWGDHPQPARSAADLVVCSFAELATALDRLRARPRAAIGYY